VFADYMQAYGIGGQRAAGLGAIERLSRLYWYTVEFGLVRSGSGVKVYGAGIASSYAESVFALDDSSPNRLGFDLRRVMQTKYRIDDFQQNYFVIDSFEDLLDQTLNTDFAGLYAELHPAPDIEIETILADDRVYSRGTQAHARARLAA
jgi:phenylalanine-4-hydroxylase